ncbi:hypothetical protein EOW77_0015980 [Bradyrhizobium yuanmingense]|uniref:hypothetical protein n=1 Tax=Bradyrhizobium yuanmingense TaxID=108015 RepID=UPI000FE40C37|nr:hypothetical protein [Bradyrhizobium yuanmingense]TGN86797.1 hypothetical protein EOW77_0015980 [Bradyrhizobium yuanmingense]
MDFQEFNNGQVNSQQRFRALRDAKEAPLERSRLIELHEGSQPARAGLRSRTRSSSQRRGCIITITALNTPRLNTGVRISLAKERLRYSTILGDKKSGWIASQAHPSIADVVFYEGSIWARFEIFCNAGPAINHHLPSRPVLI